MVTNPILGWSLSALETVEGDIFNRFAISLIVAGFPSFIAFDIKRIQFDVPITLPTVSAMPLASMGSGYGSLVTERNIPIFNQVHIIFYDLDRHSIRKLIRNPYFRCFPKMERSLVIPPIQGSVDVIGADSCIVKSGICL